MPAREFDVTLNRKQVLQLGIAGEVVQENRRQDEKWGEQNHPDFPEDLDDLLSRIPCADEARDLCEMHHASEDPSFATILLEEFCEAMEERTDVPALRRELIQVAAVCTQWVAAIDRREP